MKSPSPRAHKVVGSFVKVGGQILVGWLWEELKRATGHVRSYNQEANVRGSCTLLNRLLPLHFKRRLI